MRTAVTLAREHGKKSFKLISGPEVPIQDQNLAFKEARESNVNDKFAEVQFWESGGPMRAFKYITRKEAAERAERQKKIEADAVKPAETKPEETTVPEGAEQTTKAPAGDETGGK